MSGADLTELLNRSFRRSHLIGTADNGIIAALDLEGRLFTVVNGKVLNRVVPSAIINRSNKDSYLNPGGDALWPAPEGTCFGYEYSTGRWRVPPAITGAVWEVTSSSPDSAVIRAEIDLVNNLQVGIPCEFERHIKTGFRNDIFVQEVTELIRYTGTKHLDRKQFLLAPWSLCQFDSDHGCRVIMDEPSPDDIWDMYSPSVSMRGLSNGQYVINTKTDFRFQLGLGKNVGWIRYLKGDEFSVARYSGKISGDLKHIDISDVPPDVMPSSRGVSLSVYCDPSGFMEIEACGGAPGKLVPGTETAVRISTEYKINN